MSSYRNFYQQDDPQRFGRSEMPREEKFTCEWLTKLGISPQQVVLELGCGVGSLSRVHPRYIGLDYGFPALRRFTTRVPRIQGDMQQLPLADDSIDFVFTWAALEHVPRPELALAEIVRVLKPGGGVIASAWFCRPWAAKALPVRQYTELTWRDRLSKASIPLHDNIICRSLWIFPRRILREIICFLCKDKPTRFHYQRLNPNLAEYVYTDCDAFTSMDPHEAIHYFRSRDFSILSHPSFWRRIAVRHEPIVVLKKL